MCILKHFGRHGKIGGRTEETTSNLMDPTLRDGPITEIMRCIKIALLCVQENVSDRPSMTSVVLMLNGNFDPIPTPTQPAIH